MYIYIYIYIYIYLYRFPLLASCCGEDGKETLLIKIMSSVIWYNLCKIGKFFICHAINLLQGTNLGNVNALFANLYSPARLLASRYLNLIFCVIIVNLSNSN